jgi:hypothetical protein
VDRVPANKGPFRIASGQVIEWSFEDNEWQFIVNSRIKAHSKSLKEIMQKAEEYNKKRKAGE